MTLRILDSSQLQFLPKYRICHSKTLNNKVKYITIHQYDKTFKVKESILKSNAEETSEIPRYIF